MKVNNLGVGMSVREADRVRLPAYSRELQAARLAGEEINLHVHVGRRAWNRTQNSGNHRLVVVLDQEYGPNDFDLTCVDGLEVTLNAIDADLVLARRVAVRLCECGARMVVLLHPALSKHAEYFYSCDESL